MYMAPTILPDSWYTLAVAKDVDLNRPGIYYWVIAGGDSYIGKYSNIRRPTKHYGRIVQLHRSNGDYRKSNPRGFRRIHIALSEAIREGRKVELRILENVEPARLQERETELIRQMQPTLNGPALACHGSGRDDESR
jgi:hypothetical protein